ncbi:uncharacterized protein LOC143916875 [Arctopsyche grandis]|uniref:uncharacterized protein LOC143916875 n=1 Tax=Arctopsyche grandis TaxID=121162 RepID=UPI00406D7865
MELGVGSRESGVGSREWGVGSRGTGPVVGTTVDSRQSAAGSRRLSSCSRVPDGGGRACASSRVLALALAIALALVPARFRPHSDSDSSLSRRASAPPPRPSARRGIMVSEMASSFGAKIVHLDRQHAAVFRQFSG